MRCRTCNKEFLLEDKDAGSDFEVSGVCSKECLFELKQRVEYYTRQMDKDYEIMMEKHIDQQEQMEFDYYDD